LDVPLSQNLEMGNQDCTDPSNDQSSWLDSEAEGAALEQAGDSPATAKPPPDEKTEASEVRKGLNKLFGVLGH
jgi:hypothetical protein